MQIFRQNTAKPGTVKATEHVETGIDMDIGCGCMS